MNRKGFALVLILLVVGAIVFGVGIMYYNHQMSYTPPLPVNTPKQSPTSTETTQAVQHTTTAVAPTSTTPVQSGLQSNTTCNLMVQKEITFRDSRFQGISVREYNGMLKNVGKLNVIYNSITGKLFDRNNNLLSEAQYKVNAASLTLTEQIAFTLSFKPNQNINPNWTNNIDHYEFLPQYSCSGIGYYH